MRKVDFLIAGAQKDGTSALDAVMRRHADVGMFRVKEPHCSTPGLSSTTTSISRSIAAPSRWNATSG
ncbi:MAG: hypothetical protein GDA49_01700 [Rhodospirillales bacterium]|nr:hypothetical protein [Rhodospirillales bacterium]